MDTPALLAGLALPGAVLADIRLLIAEKRKAAERDLASCPPAMEDWLRTTLAAPVEVTDLRSQGDFGAQADDLFRKIVGDFGLPDANGKGAAPGH
jgi:hypothetical protein